MCLAVSLTCPDAAHIVKRERGQAEPFVFEVKISAISVLCGYVFFVLSLSLRHPVVESAGGGKTAASILRANDNVGLASSAAFHANRKLGPLDPVYKGTLQGGLDHFL